MTTSELIERSKRQLNAGQPEPRVWPTSEIDIAACVLQARDAVARKAMMDDSKRAWLQQVFTLALDSSGVGLLSAATAAISGEILLDGIRLGVVIDGDGNILQPILHYADFLRPQSTAYGYYNLKDGAAHTRAINTPVNGPLDIIGAPGPLSITASYVPAAVDDFVQDLEPDLVQALVQIVTLKANADAE